MSDQEIEKMLNDGYTNSAIERENRLTRKRNRMIKQEEKRRDSVKNALDYAVKNGTANHIQMLQYGYRQSESDNEN